MSQSFTSSNGHPSGPLKPSQRRNHWLRRGLLTASLSAALAATGIFCLAADSPSIPASAPSTQQTPAEFFQGTVKPILVNHCFACHANGKFRGNLRMDTRAGLLKGGKLGPALVPGKPDDSLMIEAVNQQDKLKMPPPSKGKKLTDAQIADLRQWIADGAVWSEK